MSDDGERSASSATRGSKPAFWQSAMSHGRVRALGENEFFFRQIRERQFLPPRERVIERQRDDEPLLGHHGDFELVVRLGQIEADDAEVEPATEQRVDLPHRGQLGERDFHVGHRAAKETQHVRQPFVGKLRGEADGQPAGFAARRPARGARGFVGLTQNTAGVFEKNRAGCGERDMMPAALEQRRAEFVLKLAHLRAERRLCDVQPHRGATEVQLLGDGDEVTQVT